MVCVFLPGIYETPGGTILRDAHLDIESFTMDRVCLKNIACFCNMYISCLSVSVVAHLHFLQDSDHFIEARAVLT